MKKNTANGHRARPTTNIANAVEWWRGGWETRHIQFYHVHEYTIMTALHAVHLDIHHVV